MFWVERYGDGASLRRWMLGCRRFVSLCDWPLFWLRLTESLGSSPSVSLDNSSLTAISSGLSSLVSCCSFRLSSFVSCLGFASFLSCVVTLAAHLTLIFSFGCVSTSSLNLLSLTFFGVCLCHAVCLRHALAFLSVFFWPVSSRASCRPVCPRAPRLLPGLARWEVPPPSLLALRSACLSEALRISLASESSLLALRSACLVEALRISLASESC